MAQLHPLRHAPQNIPTARRLPPKKTGLRLALGFACAVLAPAASADLWLNLGMYSFHFDKNADLNSTNRGLGLEYRINDKWSVTGGRFYNSNYAWSSYAGAYYTPWRISNARIGAALGGLNGYPYTFDGGWFPAIIPAVEWEFDKMGLNVLAVPTIKNRLYGALGFQLKFKLD